VIVSVDSLLPAESPRLEGERAEHVRALAELDDDLPPIVVHRQTMRVVDGMHRLRAAVLNDRRTIGVRFFDGTEDAAFILAVQLNTAQGLPLTRADREAAALRIVVMRPEWSDRAIAALTGLSGKTVGALRRRSTAAIPQLNDRVGRDGRVRPLAMAEGRRRAAEALRNRPDASLRQIAKIAGVSVGTAHDVRHRLQAGADPVPESHRLAPRRAPIPEPVGYQQRRRPDDPAGSPDPRERLRRLCRDPALRFTEDGWTLLRWLNARVVSSDEWIAFLDKIPPQSAYLVAELAAGCATSWREFADNLATRMRAAG
jgi:hypothetical protein